MKILERVLRGIDNINEYLGRVVSFIVVIMAFQVTYEVVRRYVFGKPTFWGFETSCFLLCGLATLGMGYALLHEGHIKIDIFWIRFKPRQRAAVDLVTALLFFLFCGILIWKGWYVGFRSLKLGEVSTVSVWEPVLWPTQILIPIGFGLLMLQGIAKFVRDFVHVITGKAFAEPKVAKGFLLLKKD